MAGLPKDAKRLADDHKELLANLQKAQAAASTCEAEILAATDSMIAEEIMHILENIPVEELNREHRGIRVKTLSDMGYHNLAQLQRASVPELAAINGISDSGAIEIKQLVAVLMQQAAAGVRLRLSMDDQTEAATRLVTAVSAFLQCQSPTRICQTVLHQYQPSIVQAMADLNAAMGGLRWIFLSREKKQKAQNAYALLYHTITSEYGRQAQDSLHQLQIIASTVHSLAWQDFERNSIYFFQLLEQLRPGLFGSDDAVCGLPEELALAIQQEPFYPDGLTCCLRRYQEWGVKYILHQKRVLLGDEMGLGKTVQAIAAMTSLRNTGATHFLVVCPASVLENWCREIRKHSPLPVQKLHGSGREQALQQWLKTGGAAVTTYETTGSLPIDDAFRFSLLVVDEAHYIKNPSAQRTVHVKSLSEHAERLLFMTGTALENKVEEMISLISILQPEIAAQVESLASLSSAPQFREAIAPVYYRRRREDVLTELPDLIETEEWCALSGREEQIYEQAILDQRFADARRVSWNIANLRQSSKAQRLLELIDEAQEDGRKIIVFSFFLDTIEKVVDLLGSRCMEPIDGSVPPQHRQEIIDAFDQAPAGTVLAAQIQAGGTGLNIQSASVVILCEPQFKPSIENQAISRAYRMGQTRNVLVYRLLCEDTVDEAITDLLAQKQAAFDAFADESVVAAESQELDQKAFAKIMAEETARVQAKQFTIATIEKSVDDAEKLY